MRKVISLILVFMLCLGMAACDSGDMTAQEESIAKAAAEALTFEEKVANCWAYAGGWNEPGDEMEFSADGTCVIDGKELTWEAVTKVIEGYTEPRDYANVYEGDVLVYEAYINIWDDGTISMVIHEPADEETEYILYGTYVKAEHDHEH